MDALADTKSSTAARAISSSSTATIAVRIRSSRQIDHDRGGQRKNWIRALEGIHQGESTGSTDDLGWKDVLGFRGARDVEKPIGQWNLIEAICDGGDVTYSLNGVKVMEGRNGSFKSGRLLFQSEAAEIYFRRIELHPLQRPAE